MLPRMNSCDIASHVWRAPRVQYRYWPHTCLTSIGRQFGSCNYGRESIRKIEVRVSTTIWVGADYLMSKEKIRTVAVVGAGVSGVVAASHLLRFGLQVTVFERSSGPGGVW
jgi:NADPH-dependent 2,4-dienoyl-CoA reductase/sulfur reductase-like enzyme